MSINSSPAWQGEGRQAKKEKRSRDLSRGWLICEWNYVVLCAFLCGEKSSSRSLRSVICWKCENNESDMTLRSRLLRFLSSLCFENLIWARLHSQRLYSCLYFWDDWVKNFVCSFLLCLPRKALARVTRPHLESSVQTKRFHYALPRQEGKKIPCIIAHKVSSGNSPKCSARLTKGKFSALNEINLFVAMFRCCIDSVAECIQTISYFN